MRSGKQLWNRALGLLALGMLAFFCDAAPFDRDFAVRQRDGQQIVLRGKGDEFFARFSHQSYTVVLNHLTQNYEYALLSADGQSFVPSGHVVGTVNPQSISTLQPNLTLSREAIQKIVAEKRAYYDPANLAEKRWDIIKRQYKFANGEGDAEADAPEKIGTYKPTIGQIQGLTILVDFSDSPGTIEANSVLEFLNGDEYTENGNVCSIKKFFQDVSSGKLVYSNALIPYVRLPKLKSYYDNKAITKGMHYEFMNDVLTALQELPNFDTEIQPLLDSVSKDEEGNALAVNFFYAGKCESGWSYGLWPAQSTLYSPSEVIPGFPIIRFMMTDMGDALRIGTFCHENGHMICGYPDLYDYATDGTQSVGAGRFCLMSSGIYLGDPAGSSPCQPSAFLKLISGWANVVDIDATTCMPEATLSADMESPLFNTIFRYTKPTNSNEFFLIENRCATNHDAYLPASGIAIWHVDLEGNRDYENFEFNDEHNNYEVCLMEADGLWTFHYPVAHNGDKNDFYYKGNTANAYQNSFTKNTNPSSRWWDGTLSHLNVLNFSEPGMEMTFSILPTPPQVTTTRLATGRVGSPYESRIYATNAPSEVVFSVIAENPLPAGLDLDAVSGLISGMPMQVSSNLVGIIASCFEGKLATTNFYPLIVLPVYEMPFVETFEETDPAVGWGWSTESVGTNRSAVWRFESGNSFEANSGNRLYPARSYSAPKNALYKTTDGSLIGTTNRLVSPLMRFTEIPKAVQLSFQLYQKALSGNQDTLALYYKTSWEGEWIFLKSISTECAGWKAQQVAVPELALEYYFMLEGVANGGYGTHIDDVRFEDPTPPLALLPALLPDVVIGQPYVFTNQWIGGVAPYTVTLSSGLLPQGLVCTPDGVISGTVVNASQIGNYGFELTIADAAGETASQSYELAVNYERIVFFREGFEHSYGTPLPEGWSQEYVVSNVTWQYQSVNDSTPNGYVDPVLPIEGKYHAVFWWGDTEDGDMNKIYPDRKTRMITPVINLGFTPQSPQVRFWMQTPAYGIHQDELRVYYRSAPTDAWHELAAYTESITNWTEVALALPNASQTYQLAFEGNAKYGNGVHLDDIRISDATQVPLLRCDPVLSEAWVAVPYEQLLSSVGGAGSNVWSAVGLPAGLSIDASTGTISGTPEVSAVGTHTVAIKITDVTGKSSESAVSLTVVGGRKIPYAESFDVSTNLPAGWGIENSNAQMSWSVTKGGPKDRSANSSPTVAASPSWNMSAGTPGVASLYVSKLMVPMLTFPEGASNAVLSCKIANPNRNNVKDVLRIKYRTTTTETWKTIAEIKTNITTWAEMSFALPNIGTTYFISFEATAKGGWGVSVDDIKVTAEGIALQSNLDRWMAEYFTEPYPAKDADSDGDGISNILEFALALNPTNALDGASGALLQSFTADGIYVGQYRESKAAKEDGFVLQLEHNLDLLNGTWSTDPLSSFADPADMGDWLEIQMKSQWLKSEKPTQFLRLRLIEPTD